MQGIGLPESDALGSRLRGDDDSSAIAGTQKRKRPEGRFQAHEASAPYRKPAAARSTAALSVRSQLNSGSSRPKCPYAAVFS